MVARLMYEEELLIKGNEVRHQVARASTKMARKKKKKKEKQDVGVFFVHLLFLYLFFQSSSLLFSYPFVSLNLLSFVIFFLPVSPTSQSFKLLLY